MQCEPTGQNRLALSATAGDVTHQHVLEMQSPLDARKFQIAIRRLADSLSYGTDRSPFLGSGHEFVQSRLYEPGDPIKSIDWRVTARTRKLHVKEYEAPKRMPVYLLVDTSASMVVSSTQRSKYALAVQMAGGLALACLDRISPVGLLGVGGRAIHIRPTLSKDRVMQWTHQLRHFRDDEPTRLGRQLLQLGPSLSSRVLLVILSDMHDPSSISAIKRMSTQHDCCVLHVRDPAERALASTGFYRAREAESGRAFVAHGRTRLADATDLRGECKRSGIDYLLIDTDQPVAVRLRQFFSARGLLGRGAR